MQKLSDLLVGLDMPIHVRRAVEKVPRHLFLAEIFREDAYRDKAIPIGSGATASRPSTVVKMLSLLGQPKKVLEIGTGCGWQTALLSTYTEVHSIEVSPNLHERAKHNLQGYDAHLYQGDGLKGLLEQAPFDGIIVCAAVREIPQILIDQLSGVMVIPIGDENKQELFRITKEGAQSYGSCGFMNVIRTG